ncbi:MAG: cytochrome P450 [Crocinitomicaceae bacterium]
MAIAIKDLNGPKGLPLVGTMFKLDLPNLHRQIEEWADIYGDVYRLDLPIKNQMVVTRPSMIQAISVDRPDGFTRAKKMDSILREGGVHGVFNAEGEEWKIHRSLVTKGLDVKHQKQFFPHLVSTVEKLYKKWKADAESGEPFDIQQDLMRFTVDVSVWLAFGYEINTLEQKEGVIQEHMEKIFPVIFERINAPIPWHRFIRSKRSREFDIAVNEMNKLVDKFIEDAQTKINNNPELRENPSNLIEAILVASETEDAIGPKEVRGDLLTLLMAGEDTTAHTLIWMIYQLASLPEVQDGIRKEVDSVISDGYHVNDYTLNSKLRYIEGVANESLRFKPVAPIILHEAIRDTEIEGYEIKEGQMILTQYRHGALSDKYFTEARSFRPERWLKESKCPVHNTDAFTPFGAGPRYCPGRNLAILEIKNVIAMLFKNFEIELVTPVDEVKEIMAFTMMASDYKVRLKPRREAY